METSLSINIPVSGQQSLYVNAFGHSVTMPCHKYGPAVRPYYLLHYILEGKGEFVADGIRYRLSAGQGFLIEPDYQTIYTADQEEPWVYIWAGFSGADAKGIVSALGLSQEHPVFRCDEGSLLKDCIQGMLAHSQGNASDRFHMLSMFYRFLSIIAAAGQRQEDFRDDGKLLWGCYRKEGSQNAACGGTDSLYGNVYVSQAISYIRNHITEPLRTETVAKYVGLNRCYLSTLFKRYTGLSPLKYIQRFRLTKAQHLLESSRMSVSAIAYACGYQQPESLMKIFRLQYGMSPSAYRKMIFERTLPAGEKDAEGEKSM